MYDNDIRILNVEWKKFREMRIIMKKLRRDEPCWCGSGKNYGECHADFDRKIETFRKKFHLEASLKMNISLKKCVKVPKST